MPAVLVEYPGRIDHLTENCGYPQDLATNQILGNLSIMAPIPPPDLSAPWHKDTVLQLRTSKMKPMYNLSITTGTHNLRRSHRDCCVKKRLVVQL